ncbi:hypothetical protein ACVW00_001224 [Marmoricola sp. URHA0025 HA25]
MSPIAQARPLRTGAALAGVAVLLLAASACGSSDNHGAPRANEGVGPQNSQGGPGSGGRMPGANGKVAAVTGSTAQVQGADGQVAVSWTGSTTFTKEVAAALTDVKVGSCVLVAPAGGPASGSTPATSVTAASVRIAARTNGSCDLGLRGPGGPGGQANGPQLNGTPPSGAPAGGQRPQVRALGGAVGEVTAVSAGGFTVDSALPGSSDKTAVAVTVGSGTSYSTTVAGAAADVKVGACVAADGTTDDTGAVTATSMAVTQPVGGQCGGMVRFSSGDGAPTTQGS